MRSRQELIELFAEFVGSLHIAAHKMTADGCQRDVCATAEQMRSVIHEESTSPIWMSGDPLSK